MIFVIYNYRCLVSIAAVVYFIIRHEFFIPVSKPEFEVEIEDCGRNIRLADERAKLRFAEYTRTFTAKSLSTKRKRKTSETIRRP